MLGQGIGDLDSGLTILLWFWPPRKWMSMLVLKFWMKSAYALSISQRKLSNPIKIMWWVERENNGKVKAKVHLWGRGWAGADLSLTTKYLYCARWIRRCDFCLFDFIWFPGDCSSQICTVQINLKSNVLYCTNEIKVACSSYHLNDFE